MQMYNKQKEIEALEKRQALSKSQAEEEFVHSADSTAQHEHLHTASAANAAANGGIYRAPSPAAAAAASASMPAAPLDPTTEVVCPALKDPEHSTQPLVRGHSAA